MGWFGQLLQENKRNQTSIYFKVRQSSLRNHRWAEETKVKPLSLLIPKSNQNVISQFNTDTLSNKQVLRIEKIINLPIYWWTTKLSELTLKELYVNILTLGLKGLSATRSRRWTLVSVAWSNWEYFHFPLDGIPSRRRVTLQHEIRHYPFIHLGGERHCES